MKLTPHIAFPVAAILLAFSPQARPAAEPDAMRLVQTISLPDVKGGFDLMAVDLKGNRLFLNAEDNNTTEVIDLVAGRRVRSLSGMHEPKWPVYRPELRKLYVANGDGEIQVFNSDTLKPSDSIRFPEKANNLRYDESSKRLYVGVGKTFGEIGIIDAKTDAIVGKIPLKSFPKQFEIEGNRAFVNMPESGEVAVLDLKKNAVIANWPVPGGKGNVPMALDKKDHILFIAREAGELVVFDTKSGAVISQMPISADADGIAIDARRKRAYISTGSGSLDVIDISHPSHPTLFGRIPTPPGAATSLFVPALDRLFLAVPQRDGQKAELRVYAPEGKSQP